MRHLKTLLSAAAFATVVPAHAAVVVLDFEGVGNLAAVNDFYNGGTDSAGNAGTNHGVSFADTSIGRVDADAGGTGNFANEPTPDTVLGWQFSANDQMNVAAGFDTGFSFFYSSTETVQVLIYDGLNATGNVLASIQLQNQYGDGCAGDPGGTFCNWTPIGVAFAGVARSVDFSGAGGYVLFDNLTLGSDVPVVPEPTTYLLMALGLAWLAARKPRP